MALQRVGDDDMAMMLEVTGEWVTGTALERRAAVAAVVEPRLLRTGETVQRALDVVERAT